MLIHCNWDIRGLLENKRNLKKAVGFICVDGECPKTEVELRDFLYAQLIKGRQVLPVPGCDNFDYEHGCQGHEENKGAAE